MPRATCRCGQRLSFPADGPERVVCPTCGARIRVRRPDPIPAPATAGASGSGVGGDGFIRFACPCGRRLKVRDTTPRPDSGRCPDCGRVVPVPADAAASLPPPPRAGDPESPTADMDAADLDALARWAESYRRKPRAGAPGTPPTPAATAAPAAPAAEVETALAPPAASASASAPVKIEAGLRVCPRCGRPVHLGAETCRQCGAHVPRR